MRWSGTLAVIAGCSFNPPQDTPKDGARDTNMDVPRDMMQTEGGFCFGSGPNLTICLPQLPTDTLAISTGTTFDTQKDDEVSPSCTFKQPQASGNKLCVRVAQTITISGPVNVVGDDPFVLLATGDMMISSPIDVASHRAIQTGAGVAACSTAGLDGGSDNAGGGGAAGGSFGGMGGAGSTGGAGAGTAGQPAAPTAPPDYLRGGCPGGDGGDGQQGNTGSKGGDGGGAIYLLAGGTLMINSTVNASGAGPRGAAPARGGAGGGGSGGMIVLSAMNLNVNGAVLVANGGGGGGGAGSNGGQEGGAGLEMTAPTIPAAGGVAGIGATAGGAGGALNINATSATPSALGGGGGGGSFGVIEILSGQTPTGATVSPPAS